MLGGDDAEEMIRNIIYNNIRCQHLRNIFFVFFISMVVLTVWRDKFKWNQRQRSRRPTVQWMMSQNDTWWRGAETVWVMRRFQKMQLCSKRTVKKTVTRSVMLTMKKKLASTCTISISSIKIFPSSWWGLVYRKFCVALRLWFFRYYL